MDTAQPASSGAPAAPSVDEIIQPAALRAQQGRADSPVLLDVRRAAPFATSTRLLAGALHVTPDDVPSWAARNRHPGARALAYCVYGHGVGAQAARDLRDAGWQALALAGGIEGGEDGVDDAAAITQWRALPPLTVAKRPDWGVSGEWSAPPSRWITRARPKIDRIACPWLIRRFIDPRAEFIYVPTEQVFDEARRRSAVAYDIPGAPISHEGERCSFDAVLAGFDLHDAALDLLATIVRGADTDRLDLAPQSAGLLAVSLGLSQLNGEDDHAMLAAAMPVYDALYAWCRSRVAGQDEAHNWKPAGA